MKVENLSKAMTEIHAQVADKATRDSKAAIQKHREMPAPDDWEAAAPVAEEPLAGERRRPSWRPQTRTAEGCLQRAAWRNQGIKSISAPARGAGSEHVLAPSPAARCAKHRLCRSQNGPWWELEALSLRGVHRDGIVVVERVEELPVLVVKRRMVHDVGGWRFQMLETRPSLVALTRTRGLANIIELRGGCAFE
jgi:hypothetical protein